MRVLRFSRYLRIQKNLIIFVAFAIFVYNKNKPKNMLERSRYKHIAKSLNLEKPLVIFDLKTTGPNISSDKIIEIAYTKITPNGRALIDNFLLNPEIKVSDLSISMHGLSNHELKNEKNFRDRAREIKDIFSDCYYAGYNVLKFDLPLLRREFIRAGMNFDYSIDDVFDVRKVVDYFEPRTLTTIYRFLCGKEHPGNHLAVADVQVTTEILEKQLERYGVIRDKSFFGEINRAGELGPSNKFYWQDGKPHLSFSKYKGKTLPEVAKIDKKFLEEIIKDNFSDGNRKLIQKILEQDKK